MIVRILILILILTGKLYSQNVEFFKSYQNNDSGHWEVNDVIEGKDGYFYLSGLWSNDSCTVWQGSLIKMDSLGNVVKKIKYPQNSFISKLLWLGEDTLLIVGVNYFVWADTGLNIVRQKEIISFEYSLAFHNAKFDPDSNLIVVGCGYNRSNPNFHQDPIMYKFNKKMEYIASLSVRGPGQWDMCLDVIFYNKEYSFFTIFPYSKTILIRTDTNLNVLSRDTLEITGEQAYVTYLNVRAIDSKKYMILSKTSNDLCVATFEYGNYQAKTVHYYVNGYPFFSLDFIDTSRIFIGGTSSFRGYYKSCQDSSRIWGESKIVLARVRTDGDSCWVKYYGRDSVEYWVSRVLATRDGGVLAIGNQFDFRDSVRKSGWFVIKVGGGICDSVVTGLDSRFRGNDGYAFAIHTILSIMRY